jgi:hypothetical protein
MANQTIDEILANVSTRRLDITLGTEINTSAEMYKDTNNRDCYGDCYTFQQSNENVEAPSAHFSSPRPSASMSEGKTKASLAFERNNVSKPKKFQQRKVTPQDYIVGIWMGINNEKIGTRVMRMNAYLSLKGEDDKKYSMFYRSKLTSAHDEIRRGILKYDNKPLLTVFEDFVQEHGRECMIGRLRLNPRKYPISDEHRYNHKHALLCVYTNGDNLGATLYLYDEYYEIELSKDQLLGSQDNFYNAAGTYERDFGEGE